MRHFVVVTVFGGLLVGGLLSSTASAEDPKPCVAKKFKISKVEAACKDGGQAAAKKLMQKAVKKAKAEGEKMNCKTCHDNLKTYSLSGKDPVGSIKKWL